MGEGESGKKAKATQHVGGQSVSEKSQVTHGVEFLMGVVIFLLTKMIRKRNTLNEKNTKTQRDRNTTVDMDEARADGDDDDEGGNLIGLVSCSTEHHTGDYVKDKTEEVLLKLGITKVGHDDGIFQKVGDNDSNMVKDCRSLPCIDHTIERIVRILWFEPKVKESFDEDKKVVTFFKSSVKQEC